jgi:hypothetical protein
VCRIEADLVAEGVARQRRGAVEPLIEALRAGDDHVGASDAVEGDGFALLRLVPDEDAVRLFPDARLARQVIPAADAERGRDAELHRRSHDVLLFGPERQQRRDENHVGPVRRDARAEIGIGRQRPLHRA